MLLSGALQEQAGLCNILFFLCVCVTLGQPNHK